MSGAGADADSKGKKSTSTTTTTSTGRRGGGVARNADASPVIDVARRTLRYDASGGAHFDRDAERRKSMGAEDARRVADEEDAVVFLCDARGTRVLCGGDASSSSSSSSSLAYARCVAVTAALGRRGGERFDGGDACYVGRDVGRDSRAVFAVAMPREGEKKFGVDGETLRAAFEEALGNTDDATSRRRAYELVNVKAASARAFNESDAAIAANEAQAEAFWRIRESLSESERAQGPALQYDISVPVAKMPAFMIEAASAAEATFPGTTASSFGHLGDGNVHFHVRAPRGTSDGPAWIAAQGQVINAFVHDAVVAAGGSISAEHGIGQMKRAELGRLASPARISALRAIKAAFDPKGLFNPGKLIPLPGEG